MSVTESKREVPTVAVAIERFLRKHEGESGQKELVSILVGTRSGRTVGKRVAGPSLANCELGPLRFDRPSSDDFVRWFHQRFPAYLAPSTRKKGRSALRQLLVFAIESRWADESVLVSLPRVVASPPRREWLRPEQVAALNRLVTREHFISQQHFMWFCLQNTGLRPSELVALRAEVLNPADGTLRVIGKGRGVGKLRQVPVSPSFQAEWQAYVREHHLRPTSWLFPVMRVRFVEGNRFSYEHEVADASRHCTTKVVRTTVNKVRDLAEEAVAKGRMTPELLPPFALSPKVLRRTYACTHLISASELGAGYGMDIRSLQDAMGHQSLETTAIYLSDVSAYLNRRRRTISVTDTVERLAA